MRSFLASCFRSVIFPIVSFRPFYLPGMVLVRLARLMREWYYKPDAVLEMRTVSLPWKMKMKVDRNSYMGGSIYWTGVHHLQELLYLDARLKPGMRFMDVGANQGEFSLFASHKVGNGQVWSFEPVTKTRQLLLDNISLQPVKNITVFDFGLSDQKGTLPIYTSVDTKAHHGIHEGLSSLYPTSIRNVLEETISLERFDHHFQNSTFVPDVIKIDVEGAEWYVLKGMHQLLEKHKPELLIEINEETFTSAGYSTKDLVSYLQSFGYKPFQIVRGRLKAHDSRELPAWGNFIFKV